MTGEPSVLACINRGLTRREQEILDLLPRGWSNKEIACHLRVSDQTIKNQLTTLYRKEGVTSRLELVVKAVNERMKGRL
jgi:DNA-binding NarL/FixJ family response regulator